MDRFERRFWTTLCCTTMRLHAFLLRVYAFWCLLITIVVFSWMVTRYLPHDAKPAHLPAALLQPPNFCFHFVLGLHQAHRTAPIASHALLAALRFSVFLSLPAIFSFAYLLLRFRFGMHSPFCSPPGYHTRERTVHWVFVVTDHMRLPAYLPWMQHCHTRLPGITTAAYTTTFTASTALTFDATGLPLHLLRLPPILVLLHTACLCTTCCLHDTVVHS